MNSILDKGAAKDGRANRLINKNTASTVLNSELRRSIASKSTSKECWLTSLTRGSSSSELTYLAAYPGNGRPSSNFPLPSAYSFNYIISIVNACNFILYNYMQLTEFVARNRYSCVVSVLTQNDGILNSISDIFS